MTGSHRMAVSARVKASPSEVFRIVTDPSRHVEIDGSGMLEAAPGARRVVAVGDTFEMAMDREPLGDLPMGKYTVLNTVTRIVPDALVEWNIGTLERGAFGHVWGWEITRTDDEETEVTNYCDWSGISEDARDRFPVIPKAMVEKSVTNLVGIVAREAPTPG